MTYLYKCPYCLYEVLIEKPIVSSDREEHCDICEGEMKRVFEAPSIKTNDGVKK